MPIKTALRPVALALLLLPALAACETLGFGARHKGDDSVDIACPPVEAPASLASTSKAGVNPTEMLATANLRIVGSKCDVSDDKVTMKIDVDLAGTRGAALKQDEVTLPFFAAIVDQNGKLLNKKLYETTFTFGSKPTDKEQLQLSFDMTKAQAGSAKIYIGYQISRDAWQAVSPQR